MMIWYHSGTGIIQYDTSLAVYCRTVGVYGTVCLVKNRCRGLKNRKFPLRVIYSRDPREKLRRLVHRN